MSDFERRAKASKKFGVYTLALREHLGLSQAEFAKRMFCHQTLVSRVETGSVPATPAFAAQMDVVAGAPGVYADRHTELFGATDPDWFKPYAELEAKAVAITNYSPVLLMGLLQTQEYTAAVYRARFAYESGEDIQARVDLRVRRQEVLARADPPRLWVVVGEGVVRTCVGGGAVMARQLRHLIELSERPGITLQVLRADDGAPPAHLPFTVVTDPDGSQFVYAESQNGGGTVDSSADAVKSAVSLCDHLRESAMSGAQSAELFQRLAKQRECE
ncbi:Scr1 family TA system antitoxin-like transcriptional regulator [Streptomyces sp. NPDC088923]|uniref:helix-turn-helix domain-containing protein n=1 Tax=Streptomyces sp. NPDC088923 TaxID=3365913 RepID=UPI0038243703